MALNIPLSLDIDEAEVKQRIAIQVENTLTALLKDQFADGKKNGYKGPVYQTLEAFISQRITQDDSVAIMEQIIEEHWPSMLRTATLTALEHKANRVAFSRIKSATLRIEDYRD